MSKIQSALEYLMTYGWAILIIAVVMGAVFGLGLFNTSSLAPRAAAGSCSVARPNGPLTTQFINLEGVCNNELPQYVASFDGSDYVTVNGVNGLTGTSNAITVTGWFYEPGTSGMVGFDVGNTAIASGTLDFINFQCKMNSEVGIGIGISYWPCEYMSQPLNNNWLFMVASYDGDYLNGWVCSGGLCTMVESSLQASNILSSGSVYIGGPFLDSWNGYIANLQVYNTSFSANDVTTLYHEGIGGAPIALPWLVGWWPLNGDLNDYSGNGYNGQANGIIFTNSWTSGYSAP